MEYFLLGIRLANYANILSASLSFRIISRILPQKTSQKHLYTLRFVPHCLTLLYQNTMTKSIQQKCILFSVVVEADGVI